MRKAYKKFILQAPQFLFEAKIDQYPYIILILLWNLFLESKTFYIFVIYWTCPSKYKNILIILFAGDSKRLKEHALCNFEYLLSMVDSSSINRVLQNLRLTLSILVDAEIFLIYNCLLKSSSVLMRHPTQLANELIGHLKEVKGNV